MASNDATRYTLANIAAHLDPTGKIAEVAEVLTVPLSITADIPWFEGNLTTGHQSTLRSTLPTGNVRQPNDGVPREVETVRPQVDTCMMVESYSEIDEFDMHVNGYSAAFRWQKDKAFLEGMNQTLARNIFYANSAQVIAHGGSIGTVTYSASPLNFDGLVKRYAGAASVASLNVRSAYGTTPTSSGDDSNSIWLIGWGPGKVYGIYPKGTQAGLSMEDKGKQTITTWAASAASSASKLHEAWVTHFKWYAGIVVEDWRFCVRIMNIDTSAIASITDLSSFMIDALDLIPDLTACNPVFYMNRFIKSTLRKQAAGKANIWYKPSEFGGPPVEYFQTVPIHRCDMLGSSETDEATSY